MKLCIPICTPNGLESRIEPHLPHAEHLLCFDTEKREYEQIALRQQPEGAGKNLQVDAVLCGSIDHVVMRMLAQQGIKVYGVAAQTAAQAIAQYENGELESAVENFGSCSGQKKNPESGSCHDNDCISSEGSCQGCRS